MVSLGPECETSSALDAVESVEAYTTSSRAIVVADHSGHGSGRRVQEAHRDVHVSEMDPGALDDPSTDISYVHLARVFAEVLRGHQFDALLRMRDDALITAPHPEAAAIACFDHDPLVGAAGRYRPGSDAPASDRGSAAQKLRQQMFAPARTDRRHSGDTRALASGGASTPGRIPRRRTRRGRRVLLQLHGPQGAGREPVPPEDVIGPNGSPRGRHLRPHPAARPATTSATCPVEVRGQGARKTRFLRSMRHVIASASPWKRLRDILMPRRSRLERQ